MYFTGCDKNISIHFTSVCGNFWNKLNPAVRLAHQFWDVSGVIISTTLIANF